MQTFTPEQSDAISLETLQVLADIKLATYKAKWSKASDDHIARLERDYNDKDALIKYFTKR